MTTMTIILGVVGAALAVVAVVLPGLIAARRLERRSDKAAAIRANELMKTV